VTPLGLLRLLQLADSALPVGAASHSFGLESLVEEGLLPVDALEEFLADWLEEGAVVDAAFCRAAHQDRTPWTELNALLSARKPARESREASLMMGRRLLQLAARLVDLEPGEAHYACAFGRVAARVGVEEDAAVLAFLQQTVAGWISACQRLMPLGQTRAAQISWVLKPVMARVAGRASGLQQPGLPVLPELCSMRHPHLRTRLFIS
jgi:urease accessory protein